MKVGMVGLGKLGLPVALAMALRGHDVVGYDIDPERMQKERYPYQEMGPDGEPSIEPMLRTSSLRFGSLPEVVRHSDVLFVAVQTPHDPRYEGVTRLPDERLDFDYSYLVRALETVSSAVHEFGESKIVVILSTVLPGTIRREIMPRIRQGVKLCYSPCFIAMGTTMSDFLAPEFVLLGSDDDKSIEIMREFYLTLHDRFFFATTIENSEIIKLAYNTFITTKICFANTLMEMCHKLPGGDVDTVSRALSLATDRLVSPRYMRGGMADGGSCHPRDNIALSWLAREIGLSHDWFETIMRCRENQTSWLADLAEFHHRKQGFTLREIGIYGKAFKAESNITAGSPARLLANLIAERGYSVAMYDPLVDEGPCPFSRPGVYVVATNHQRFAEPVWNFPRGSVILDPWRYIPEREGVEVVHIGTGPVNEDAGSTQARVDSAGSLAEPRHR